MRLGARQPVGGGAARSAAAATSPARPPWRGRPRSIAASARASLASTESPCTSAPMRRSDTKLFSLPSRRCQKELSARSSAIAALGHRRERRRRGSPARSTPLALAAAGSRSARRAWRRPGPAAAAGARSVAKGWPAVSAALMRAAMPITAEPRAAASAFCSPVMLASPLRPPCRPRPSGRRPPGRATAAPRAGRRSPT